MENENKIKVALIRGDSLNSWEGKLWGNLDPRFSVSGVCSKRNLYDIRKFNFSVEQLATTSDNFILRNYNRFVNGIFQKMNGLEKLLKNFNIAHTAEISYYYTLQAVRAKKLNPGLKVVTTVWDNSFGRFEYNYWPGFKIPPAFWRKKIMNNIKEVIDGVDMFLPVTKMSSEMLIDCGVKEEKIQILTPGILMEESGDVMPDRFGLSGKELYFMVNRLVKEKGVYDVLYAWRMYQRHKPDGNKVLLVIGKGPEERNMKRLVFEWGMNKSVMFMGVMPNGELRHFYRQAKALILASLPNPLWQEQFGFVLAEAISQNCPVVSAYSGAIPEVIEDAGLLFTPGNPVELRDCLLKLDDAAVYEKLKSACNRVKAKFVAKEFRTKLVEIYNQLV